MINLYMRSMRPLSGDQPEILTQDYYNTPALIHRYSTRHLVAESSCSGKINATKQTKRNSQ